MSLFSAEDLKRDYNLCIEQLVHDLFVLKDKRLEKEAELKKWLAVKAHLEAPPPQPEVSSQQSEVSSQTSDVREEKQDDTALRLVEPTARREVVPPAPS